MGQEIKLGVSADVKGAEKGADQLADALDGVATATAGIANEAKKTNAELGKVVDRMREIKAAQAFLSQELKRPISDRDAGVFVDNMTRSRKFGIRDFGSVEGWINGHTSYYGRNANAARRKAIAVHMDGTDDTRAFGTPGPTGGGGGGGDDDGGGRGGSAFGAGVNRAKNAAFGFGKSMLALAGINSLMGMAGRGIDNATEESTGIDTLKRRMGDLGVDFEELRNQARMAGQGLGVTYVESQRLAQSYSREVGNLSYRDVNGIGRSVRLGEGFSRSYGLDLEQGNQFFGTMARTGVARDEAAQRRLALMIGDAVAKSGYTGKVDELLSAVADYSNNALRQTLTVPNAQGYTAGLTSLMSNYQGLGPSGAAAILNQADSAIRRGGNRGEASMSFLYSAMRASDPGISPLQAQELWEGGLFSTDANTFGGKGPFAGLGPSKSNATTFEKMMRLLKGRHMNPHYMAATVQGLTGLTLAQSRALVGMDLNGQLGQSTALLKAAGIDPGQMSVTGMQGVAQVANARTKADLQRVHDQLRGNASVPLQKELDAAMGKGSADDIRKALAVVAAKMDQEQTQGTSTRNSIAGLNDTLTSVGKELLGPLNGIRDAVIAVAQHFDPGYTDMTGAGAAGARGAGQSPYTAGSASKSSAAKGLMQMAMGLGASPMEAAGLLGNAWQESKFDPKASVIDTDGKRHNGMFQLSPERWNEYAKWARGQGMDEWTHLPQLMWAIKHDAASNTRVGSKFRMARDLEANTAAGVLMERPGGYSAIRENYKDANGWASRFGAAQDLYLLVEVKQPDGSHDKHRVKLTGVTPPQPAGAAPRVHSSYSSDQDYR